MRLEKHQPGRRGVRGESRETPTRGGPKAREHQPGRTMARGGGRAGRQPPGISGGGAVLHLDASNWDVCSAER